MPNRIIKESICTSESVDQMTWFEECFFHRLWTACDDFGRMDARPAILKAKLFPLKDRMTHKDINDALQRLADIGCVITYVCDGKPYLYLPAWEVHQSIRAKKSKFPSPDESEIICMQLLADENKCHRNPIQSESNPYIVDSPPKVGKREIDSFFEQIWSIYPKKEGKGQVGNAQKQKLYSIGIDEVTRAVNRYIEAKQGKDRQFLQNGSTFFNSGYVDYLDANYQPDGPDEKPKSNARTVEVPEGW